jgi:hypothetical protein
MVGLLRRLRDVRYASRDAVNYGLRWPHSTPNFANVNASPVVIMQDKIG